MLLAAAPAVAQVEGANYEDWDIDGDAGVNQEEFGTGFGDNADVFNNWDSDGDGALNEEEFNAGFRDLDTANANLSADFEADFDTIDADGNGEISENELNENVFNAYDADGNEVVEEPEFGDLGDDIGDGGFWDI